MELRVMTQNDNLAVKRLIQESLELVGFNLPGTAYYDPQLADLYSYYTQTPNSRYWVVVDQGAIIAGVGIADFDYEGTCELQKLYVHQDYQGQGLSKTLMTTALDYAQTAYQACYLETHTDLVAACRLYEAYGFDLLPAPISLFIYAKSN